MGTRSTPDRTGVNTLLKTFQTSRLDAFEMWAISKPTSHKKTTKFKIRGTGEHFTYLNWYALLFFLVYSMIHFNLRS